MVFAHEAAQHNYSIPVHETGLTPSEIQELSTLFQSTADSPFPGLEGSTRMVYSVEERKRRRMISNRKSARLSRWRKKKRLEDLMGHMNQLKAENRELKNRLGSVLKHGHLLWRVNDHLRYESVVLRARLSDLCHILVAMHQRQ